MKQHELLIPALLLVIPLCHPCLAQSPSAQLKQPHHVALTIRGDQHPEQISDQRAWLMELIAATPKESGAKRPLWLDKATLADFRTQFDRLTTLYNAGLSDGQHGTTAADIALRQQFFEDVEQLLKITIGELENSMSPADWDSTVKHIQKLKAKMTVTDDAPSAGAVTSAVYHPGQAKLVRTTQTVVIEAYAAAGYTTFSELYTDGSYWHSIVHLYGSSNATWTCQYNSYDGRWEPPGCPAHHDFYTSNKISGQGYTNAYETTAWNPAQYVGISHEFDQPVGPNNGSETVYTDASIICSVAGTLLGPSVDKVFDYIKRGTTYEQWNNTVGTSPGGNPTCGVYAVCSNPPPYLVDLPYTFANVNGCSRGYSCNSLCAHAPGLPWVCFGNDPTKTLCLVLTNGAPMNPKQNCDAHP